MRNCSEEILEKVIGALAMSRGVYARTRACVFDLEKVGVLELCSGGFCVSFFLTVRESMCVLLRLRGVPLPGEFPMALASFGGVDRGW